MESSQKWAKKGTCPSKSHIVMEEKHLKIIIHTTEAAFIPWISSVIISFSVKSNYKNQAQLIFGRQCVAKT